jgi:SAM-dependent methyltransferase
MWDHGYHSRTTYSSGYYRELAPDWLDYAALLRGHQSPRHTLRDSFHYLELGCGLGFGLCQMAAAYGEGMFVGVDFNPAHISQARSLAAAMGLTNIQFIDADFLALSKGGWRTIQPSGEQGFHYVSAHGIYTWVIEPVRDALLQLASDALVAGGLFYCSYNTYPGWLARSAFQKLLALEQERSDPTADRATFETTLATCQQLLGTDGSPSPLGASFPFLQAELATIHLQDLHYLNGEFSNAGWAPVYVATMHRHGLQHRLAYLTSATLPDGFEQLLAPSLQEPVLKEGNPLLRQTLIDLATNKAFRRDLFVKGVNQLTQRQAAQQLSQLHFLPLEAAPPISAQATVKPESGYTFSTSYGQVIGDPGLYNTVAAVLNRHEGCCMADLQDAAPDAAQELPMILALFLDAGRIAINRGPFGEAATAGAQLANHAVITQIQAGRDCTSIVLPRAGISVGLSLIESLVLEAHRQGLQGEMLSSCVSVELESLGARLLDSQHAPISSLKEALKRVTEVADDFISRRLPAMERLGAFPRQSPPASCSAMLEHNHQPSSPSTSSQRRRQAAKRP